MLTSPTLSRALQPRRTEQDHSDVVAAFLEMTNTSAYLHSLEQKLKAGGLSAVQVSDLLIEKKRASMAVARAMERLRDTLDHLRHV